MTLDEVQNEIVRLNNIKRQLVEEALKSYDAKAKQYVGKCYKMERSGIVFKILREPRRVCDVDCHYRYDKNIFSALFIETLYITDTSFLISPPSAIKAEPSPVTLQ